MALVAPADIGLEITVAEDGATFLANAQKKARGYAAASGLPALADDSGLVVDALGGEPGVDSAVWGGPELDSAGRNRLLLERMSGVTERRARYVCVLCLCLPAQAARDVWVESALGRSGGSRAGRAGLATTHSSWCLTAAPWPSCLMPRKTPSRTGDGRWPRCWPPVRFLRQPER